MNIEVNYKNKKRYKAKYPIRQPWIIAWLIKVISWFLLLGKDYRIEKVNMEGLKPPYILLSNHMYFIDFELAALATYPHRLHNVVSIDGYYRRPFLLELIGAICTRKFTMDLHLVRSIRKVTKRGDVLCMYPEARYSPCGVTSYIPDAIGRLVKQNGVPVVTIVHHGNYLHTPFWNYRKKRKVPMHTVMTQLLTAEQVKEMTPEEINEAIRKGLQYDEYKYQKDNGILITEPFRAEGLHKVLYQCPHCKTESQMDSKGAELFCKHCGKVWTLQEDGSLQAKEGETEFTHVPDWFAWERKQVEEQIASGTYSFGTRWRYTLCPVAGGSRPWGRASFPISPEKASCSRETITARNTASGVLPSRPTACISSTITATSSPSIAWIFPRRTIPSIATPKRKTW